MYPKLPEFLLYPDPEVYLSDNFVVVDFETVGESYGTSRIPSNRLVMASWWDNKEGKLYSCYNDEYHQSKLLEAVEKADYIVAHNAKYELGWLARCGMERGTKIVACTQIAEYVIAGNRRWGLSLDECLERHKLGAKQNAVSRCIKASVPVDYLPRGRVVHYCDIDVLRTRDLWLDQRDTLRDTGLLPVFYTRCLLTPVLEDMERYGMYLDGARVERVYQTYNAKLNQLLREFEEFSGGINPKSPAQMAEFVYDTLKFPVPKDWAGRPMMTPGGTIPSTDADAMAALVPKTKKQHYFKALRGQISKYQETVTKYLKKMKECVENDGGILYANLNQTIARTHRLTSTGSNYPLQFQNMQRDLKPLFAARYEGWEVVEVDQAQLEYRVAVDLAQDRAGMEDIRNRVDSHAVTASIVFKEEWDRVKDNKDSKERKACRTASKAHTFAPLYGGQSGTPAQREYYKFFLEKHEDIRLLQDSWIEQVMDTGKLRTVTGLIFYWLDTKMTKTGYITNTTAICNYPNQMFATADIVPVGLVYTWHLMKANNMKSFLVNTVHDSQIAEVAPEEMELYKEIAVQSQEKYVVDYIEKVYNYKMTVPLEAEVSSSSHWSDSPSWQLEFLGEEFYA